MQYLRSVCQWPACEMCIRLSEIQMYLKQQWGCTSCAFAIQLNTIPSSLADYASYICMPRTCLCESISQMLALALMQIRLPGQETYLTCCLRSLSTAICHNIKLHVYTNSTGLSTAQQVSTHTHTGGGRGEGSAMHLPWSDLHFCLDMTSVRRLGVSGASDGIQRI